VLGFIRTYPQLFAKLTLVRTILFWTNPVADISDDLQPATILYHHTHVIVFSALAWTGLVLMFRQGSRYAWLLAPLLLVYPVLYYISSSDSRYRHPIEPLMLLLAVYAVTYALRPNVIRLTRPGSAPD